MKHIKKMVSVVLIITILMTISVLFSSCGVTTPEDIVDYYAEKIRIPDCSSYDFTITEYDEDGNVETITEFFVRKKNIDIITTIPYEDRNEVKHEKLTNIGGTENYLYEVKTYTERTVLDENNKSTVVIENQKYSDPLSFEQEFVDFVMENMFSLVYKTQIEEYHKAIEDLYDKAFDARKDLKKELITKDEYDEIMLEIQKERVALEEENFLIPTNEDQIIGLDIGKIKLQDNIGKILRLETIIIRVEKNGITSEIVFTKSTKNIHEITIALEDGTFVKIEADYSIEGAGAVFEFQLREIPEF